MKRMFVFLILFAVSGLSAIAQETGGAAAPIAGAPVAVVPVDPVEAAFDAIRSGQFEIADVQLAEIRNPAAKLFVQASLEKAKGNLKHALETVTQGIVLYPNDSDWTGKSELMSSALYIELGMLDAADVTARQIQKLYEGTEVAVKADALRSKIVKLREEIDSKKGNI